MRALDRSALINGAFSGAPTIQPHGIIVVLDAFTLAIECVSENVQALLDLAPHAVLGKPIDAIVAPREVALLRGALRDPAAMAPVPYVVTLVGGAGKRLRVECRAQLASRGTLILECEAAERAHDAPTPAEAYLPIERLAAAGDIAELLAATARDVRAVCRFDRTLIYRFDADWRVTLVAESSGLNVAGRYMERALSAAHVPETIRRLHARGPLHFIPDTHYRPVRLVALEAGSIPTSADLSNTVLRSVSPDLLDPFVQAASRAILTIAVLVRGRLWGLVACHHGQAHPLGHRRRAACELITQTLAWQLDTRLERERLAALAGAAGIPDLNAAHLTGIDHAVRERNPQTAALIALHEDVAGALASRPAIIDVILNFARLQTRAEGSAVERITETEIVCEAATGILERLTGQRIARVGSLSGSCVELDAPLRCADAMHDARSDEHDVSRKIGVSSLVVVPVRVSERETLVLKVAATRRGAFSDEQIQTLKLAATNLRTALRAAREFAALTEAEREQRAYARRLRALHAIASTTHSNRKDQIDAALQLGLEQLDLDWGFLGVIDYATSEFAIENSVGRGGNQVVETGLRTKLGATAIGRVARAKGVQIVHDMAQAYEPSPFDGWSAYIAAPLFIGGVNYGTIGFTSRDLRPQPFSEANIEFVAVAAELISSAVERGLQRERLETSETRYRALTEAIPELVWVADNDGRFEYVNARWTQYTGLTLEESRKHTSAQLFEPADVPTIAAKNGRHTLEERDCEVRVRRRDGSFRWHLVRSVPFRDSAGDAGKWLVTAADIEERKSAEALMANVHDAALAATEAKSRFLATMSHEIRTPMNAVIGMTELLLLTQLSDEQREYIEIVRDSGQSLLRVLNDILDYSKIEAGKLELESVHFDLVGQIDSVVELLRAQYQIKGVSLSTNIGVDVPPVVSGDPGRLRQILLNLAGNALKFTAPGGKVHIDVAAEADGGDDDNVRPIRFTVEDTGIGISPEVVRKLFQPFSQGDESTTRKYGGTGLGLSICAQLVSLMNGQIGVNSTLGQGAAFWFVIPVQGVMQAAKTPDGRKRGTVRSKPVIMRAEKILLVEDNEINTFLALKQLQRIGFTVSAVDNGRKAVEAVENEHFDLVLMDCHMPEMDGFAATSEIRRREAGGQRHLPIVAMTADARTEDHENCLRAGMDDYVSKPTSLESLRVVLDRWLPTPDRRQNSRTATSGTGPVATLRVTKLLEIFDGDRNAVITLLSAAVGSIKADFARIEQCAASGEFAAVAEAAHRLKGTSATIRSPRLGEASAAIERAAQTADGELPEALLAELRAAVVTLSAEVDKHSKVLATIG